MDDTRTRTRRRAVGYIRVSDRGEDSYEELATRQIDLISAWALENDADVLGWYFDIGVDGSEPLQGRPAGIRLLDRVRFGDLNFVVVASLDAFGRAQVLHDALRLVVDANVEMGVVGVLPTPREELDPLGARRVELGPTAPLEPQVGPEALN
jgi:Resolvase, N terminal domain